MDYMIESVVSKRPERPNKWHPLIVGKRCSIERLWLRMSCVLMIEGLVDWEENSRFHTTPVLEARDEGDKLIVETENSVYTLVPREKKDVEESND